MPFLHIMLQPATTRNLTQEVKIPTVETCNWKSNLDLNEPVLVLVTFADGDPLEEASSSTADVGLGLDVDEEEGGEGNNSADHLDDYGYGKEGDLDD